MPSLKIQINPYTGENSFFKNQSRIGSKSHSPFRNLTSSSIFGWIKKFPSLAENEMNDKYDLVVSAPEFESALIRLTMKGQSLCTSFSEEAFEVPQSVAERLEVANILMNKYVQGKIDLPQINLIQEETEEGILLIKIGNIYFRIDEGLEESIEFTNDGILWRTPDKGVVSKIIHDRFCKTQSLLGLHGILKEYTGHMSDTDKDTFDSLLLTEPCILPTVNSEIEIGVLSTIGIKVIPEGIKCPDLKVTVDNPAFEISGLSLTAHDIGKGVVSISRYDNPEDILTFDIRSFRHNIVTAIDVSSYSDTMECGSSQVLSVTVDPSDAEDADKLSIVSQNPDILKVINGNTIEAVYPGNGVILVNCTNCSKSIHIDVLPKLESIKLNIDDKNEFRVGECVTAKLLTTPIDAFPHDVFVESSDTSVITIENYLNAEYRIKAKCIGNCEIIIKDKNGAVLHGQSVHVISTLYKKKKPSYTAFFGLASLLLCVGLAMNLPKVPEFVLWVLMIGALFLSLWSIFKEKRHYLTSVIVAGAALWFLGYAVIGEIRERSQKTENTESTQTTVDNGNRK